MHMFLCLLDLQFEPLMMRGGWEGKAWEKAKSRSEGNSSWITKDQSLVTSFMMLHDHLHGIAFLFVCLLGNIFFFYIENILS